ncbi:MAG TPA: phospholipase D-like domain-containing protein [Bacteroidota bacterium]
MTKLISKGWFSLAVLSLLVALFVGPQSVKAQSIIVNEVYNSSLSTDEWVELLVVQDSLDLRNWSIRDFNGSGVAQAPLVFNNIPFWSVMRKGTLIVIGLSGISTPEDTDPSDYTLVIKTSNSTYFTGTSFLFSGASDEIEIRNSATTHIFDVSWGSANAGSSPQVHFTGASSSNTSMAFQGNDTSQLSSTGNWLQNTTASQGLGNSPTNTAWISALHAHADGSGFATIDPDTTKHGVAYTLTIDYHRDTAFTITDMRIIIPRNFAWSHSTGDVNATNITATTSVSGDTIYFNSITFNVDTTVITIMNVTGADSTAFYPINVQTKSVSDYDNTIPIPKITNFGLPITVGEVKANDANGVLLRAGNLVTVSGIVTVANQFGSPSYIQDNTGGIGIFGSNFSTAVQTGDEVIVTGKIDPFNGLTEMTFPTLDSIVSTGNTVTPVVLTNSQVTHDGVGGLESYEALLVRINGVTVTDLSNNTIASWAVSGSGANYRLHDATDTLAVRIDNNVDFANGPAPQSTFDIVGVVGQFKSSSPFIGGYQLMPRGSTDILAAGPIITTLPYETNLTQTSLRINWVTANNGTSRLRYGTTTAYELGVVAPDTIHRTVHAIDLTGLSPATIYHVQAFSVSSDTSRSGDLVVSTSSPPASTGVINVYFNKTVNTSVSFGENALGNQDLVSLINNRIDHAQRSIDLALYSLSATNQGAVIASHLVSAKNRGVSIRVICEDDNYGTGGSAFPTLVGNGIPLITDKYDLVWNGQALSHNKFFVIDGRGGAPESVWVWTGSWNPTSSGTLSDRQNSIEIQDQALAGAYTTEFNLMWGSSTETPNQANSRFGGRKTDIVPHHFTIGGVPVSVYFSPSDHTTSQIRSTMAKAQSSIAACILTFTRKDIADTIITRKNLGKKARLVIDNNTDTGNQFAYLQSNGVDVHLKGGTGLLHHKYAVIDGDDISGTQYLVTGSHNWSNSAETSNDENTLIIQDRRIANLYLQEFVARYYEAGGTDSIHVTSASVFSVAPSSLNFGSVSDGGSKMDSLTVSNPGNLSFSVSAVASTNGRFSVTPTTGTIAPSASQKFYVTFSPLAPGLETGSIIFTHDAPGSPDTVAVQGTGTGGPPMVTTAMALTQGWNLLSLPSLVPNGKKEVVFPGASSRAFNYSSGYFVPPNDSLSNGYGYWVKFDSAHTDSVTGIVLSSDSVTVTAGWNIIGSLSVPVAAASVVQHPGNNINSKFYGYDSAYSIADSIRPGKGYWVRVNQNGSLSFSASGAAPKVAAISLPESFNSLTVADASGNRKTLYFGAQKGDSPDVEMYSLPPVPPPEAFDVRFRSGRSVETYTSVQAKPAVLPIQIQTAHLPLSVSWSIAAGEKTTFSLRSAGVSGGNALQLSGTGKATFTGEVPQLLLTIAPSRPVPDRFSLEQNFPNPFNPVTTIPFAVPRQAAVTLRIFNVLGEVVGTLLQDQEYQAGYFSVGFDASRLSSGVYYYEFAAKEKEGGNFRQVKKLVLVR